MAADLTPPLVVFVFAFACGLALLFCLVLLAKSLRANGGRMTEALVADRPAVAQSGAGGLIWTIRGLAVTKALAMITFALMLSEAL